MPSNHSQTETLAHADQARPAVECVAELFQRIAAQDLSAIDELMHPDMVNHAAGPQGAAGWREISSIIRHDLGPITIEQHALFGDGEMAVQHMTVHGTHHHSAMPLLQGVPPSGATVAWEFIHIWRTKDGQIVEHWACRDDIGFLRQCGNTVASAREFPRLGDARPDSPSDDAADCIRP